MENKEPPIAEATTLREVNLHLGFIREKMVSNNLERQVDMKDIKDKLKVIAEDQVNRTEFEELKKIVSSQIIKTEVITTWKDTLNGKMWGIISAGGAIWAIITLITAHFWR